MWFVRLGGERGCLLHWYGGRIWAVTGAVLEAAESGYEAALFGVYDGYRLFGVTMKRVGYM